MARSLYHHELSWSGQTLVKRDTKTCRNDYIVLCNNDDHRLVDAGQIGCAVIAILEQETHGQPRIVVRSNVSEPIPRGDQQRAGNLVGLARSGGGNDCGPKRLADQKQRSTITAVRELDGLFCILHQASFADLARPWSVGGVLGQNDAKSLCGQHWAVESAVADVSGVAVEDNHSSADGGALGPGRVSCIRCPLSRASSRFGQQSAEVLDVRPCREVIADQLLDRCRCGKIEQVILEDCDCRDDESDRRRDNDHRPCNHGDASDCLHPIARL